MKKTFDLPAELPPASIPSILGITTELCKERFTALLREQVGPGKRFGVEAASEDLGVDRRTVESYLSGENLPPTRNLLRMCFLFGPDFADGMLHLAGLFGCQREAAQPVTDFALNAETAAMMAVIGEALKDGRVDHRERALVLRHTRKLRELLDDWIIENDALPARRGR